MRKISIGLIIILLVASLGGCDSQQRKNDNLGYISDSEFLLDTIVTIKLYGYEDTAIFEEVFNYIRNLEKLLSVHIEGSDMWHLKQNAGKQWTEVSKYTIEIIQHSIEISLVSEGFFDITAGPLINLWDIDPPYGHYPSERERENALALINYKDIEIDKDHNRIYLEREGMEANLGAIAKGYIADKVKQHLIEKGIDRGIINLGGNVLLIGNRSNGKDFKIGVQDPDSLRGEYLGLVSASDKSIVSSGTYERYFIYENKKYHHILNPFTGFPQENGLKGVSIISNDSTNGDAFSTTIFLLGIEKGMTLVESREDLEAIFVTDDNKLYLSSGLKERFELAPESGYVIVD